MSYCHFLFFSIYAITASICFLVFLTIYLIIIVSMIDTTKITDITIIFVEKSLIKNSTMNGKPKINVLIIAIVNIISDDFLAIFLLMIYMIYVLVDQRKKK